MIENPRGIGNQTTFPLIPLDSWRRDAECARTDKHDRPVYDATLWDAPSGRNRVRQVSAKRICNTLCTVRAECAADYDWRYDEGVRGGHETPPLARSGYLTERDKRLSELLREGKSLDVAVSLLQHGKRAG